MLQSLPDGIDTNVFETGSRFSGGERQRAAFAVALAMGSEILILDEPFANVDKKTRSSLLTLLKDLNNKGVTIIVCDHEYQLYLNYADTFYYLSNGSLELIENPSIIQL